MILLRNSVSLCLFTSIRALMMLPRVMSMNLMSLMSMRLFCCMMTRLLSIRAPLHLNYPPICFSDISQHRVPQLLLNFIEFILFHLFICLRLVLLKYSFRHFHGPARLLLRSGSLIISLFHNWRFWRHLIRIRRRITDWWFCAFLLIMFLFVFITFLLFF